MTAWRRSLPSAHSRPALPDGLPASVQGEAQTPWVPDDTGAGTAVPPDATPQAGPSRQRQAPPAPGARPAGMPVVVSEWELADEGDGSLAARPRLLAVPRSAVTVKDDDAPGRERVRRFVEAWRWLIAARAQICQTGLSADESDRYLAGAGVLVRVVPPGSRRRSPPRR